MKGLKAFRRAPNPEDGDTQPVLRHQTVSEPGGPSSEPVAARDAEASLTLVSPTQPIVTQDTDQTAAIRLVWGDGILAEPAKVNAILHARSVIAEENATMLEAAVNMGRALIDAREVLSPDEFSRGLRASRQAWRGWSRPNVVKLIAVAEFFDRHRLQSRISESPQHYTTLYEFSLLDDHQFRRAREHGLFRPDVRRADIQAFKQRLSAPGSRPDTQGPKNPYQAEIDSLTLRLRRLEGEAARAKARKAELVAQERLWMAERKARAAQVEAGAEDADEAVQD